MRHSFPRHSHAEQEAEVSSLVVHGDYGNSSLHSFMGSLRLLLKPDVINPDLVVQKQKQFGLQSNKASI